MKRFFTILLSVITISAVVHAQEAVVTIEAMSPVEIHDLGWDSTYTPSSGLSVVGNMERTYLVVSEASGEEITGVTWAVVSKPAGSNATVDSNTVFTTFSTDLVGQYLVSATITTASGTDADTTMIVAAEYVGAGGVGGIPPNVGEGQCTPCHFPIAEDWMETGHASMFERSIDGLTSSHYGEHCVECHTVGYNEFADNGGFDDEADASGWMFPETLEEGNWDNIVNNYPEVAKKSNIQCENCHGPGSIHLGNPENIDYTLDEGMCGRCHEEEPYHRKNLQWKNSRHAVGVAYATNRTSCNPCHSGWGFVQFASGLQYIDQNTGVPQVTCAVCHDPHSVGYENQIRIIENVELENNFVVSDGGKGKLCMNCHKSRRDAEVYASEYHDHFGPHHSGQTDMLFGTNAVEYGYELPSSNHGFAAENACVNCHMAPTAPAGNDARDKVGEHSFAMFYEDYDNVSGCVPCHGPIDSFHDIMANGDYDEDGTIESVWAEVDGLKEKVAVLLPPFGENEVVVDTTEFPIETYTPEILKASYNYFFVLDDHSNGMHNAAYTIELLRLTHAQLTGTSYVEEYQSNMTPAEFVLSQNYPNPFNPSTTITYSIPEQADVTIKIYDALGKEVETLVDGFKSAGTYQLTWNAKELASGIYFYRIVSGNFVQTKKMLLLK